MSFFFIVNYKIFIILIFKEIIDLTKIECDRILLFTKISNQIKDLYLGLHRLLSP